MHLGRSGVQLINLEYPGLKVSVSNQKRKILIQYLVPVFRLALDKKIDFSFPYISCLNILHGEHVL